MTNQFIENFSKRVVASNLASGAPLVGCSEAEVAEIEAKLQVKLPPIYRSFLLKMGRGMAGFCRDDDRLYPELLTLTQGAQDLLDHADTDYRLPSTAFVFWLSESGYFLFFDTTDGDDPPVFLYRDNTKEPIRKDDHFSETLDYLLAAQIESQDKLQ